MYGGPILSTWFDRPLSAAGRVVLKNKNNGESILSCESVLFDFEKPVLTIPNLAIHMNREVNEGFAINKQKDTLPLLGILNDACEADNFLLMLIAEKLDINAKHISDFNLYLYDTHKGCFTGAGDKFLQRDRKSVV